MGVISGVPATGQVGRFEQFLEFAPDAIVGIGRDGRVVVANAQTAALFGYTRTELLGKPAELLVPERFHAQRPLRPETFVADPGTRPTGAGVELFGRRKDGSEFPAEIRLSAIDGGDDLSAIAAIRDISERRDADRARAYLAAIVDSSDDAIIGKDLDGTIVSWNHGAERLYGYRADEVIGRHVALLIPADRADETDRLLAQVGAGHVVEYDETIRVGNGGESLRMSLTASPIRDDRDRIVGAATIGRDISKERSAQRKFEQFLEHAPDAIVGVGTEGRIILANAQTEALFGYSRDELLGAPVELLVPDRFREQHPGPRNAYFSDPVTRPMGAGLELFGRRKGGEEFPAEISLSGIETEDGLLATAAIRDITDRVNAAKEKEALRAELEESRRVDAADEKELLEGQLNQLRRLESVGQLAGGIAHDFNNILGVILNYADFVAEELADDSPVLEDVEEIKRAAERAATLTRQLLIFSRREVVRPEVLDLNAVVEELDRLLRRALGEHVVLETRFAPDLASVEADPGQLEQVLVNLAVNARDAMPTGGRLMIQTANVELDEAFEDVPAGSYVRLLVSDTGTGMSREVAARVFEPFFSTKPRSEGTGLGLPTVYGIVAEAGGSIHIYSEPGIGTTVKVHLPANSAQAPSAGERPKPVHPPGHGETVLVVEDEDTVRLLTERILVRAGYKILSASAGGAALEAVARDDQPIDLMLTDVVMPEMLGPELVERASVIRPRLRVLYMSGYIHQAVAQLGIENPEDLVIVEKPFTAFELLTRVRQALDGAG
jgi:two-component system cell cycle sensor histidine kinase/response regulator CckA